MKKNNLKNTLKKVAALSLMLGILINFGKVIHDLSYAAPTCEILLFQVDLVIKIIAINQISISKSDFNVEAMDSAFECNSNMRSIEAAHLP